MSHLVLEWFRHHLEEVAGEDDTLVTLVSLLPLQCTLG